VLDLPTLPLDSQYNNNSHAQISYGYNHYWNIAKNLNANTINGMQRNVTQELLMYDGKYISANYNEEINGYMNYDVYMHGTYSPQPDYSEIKTEIGHRYATFVWECPVIAPPYLYAKFIIYGCTVNVINQLMQFTQKDTTYQMNLFFRFEDGRNRTLFTSDYNNTTWINATNNVSTLDLFKNNNIVAGGKFSGFNNICTPDPKLPNEKQTYTITLYTSFINIYSNNQNNKPLYLFARMQLPMKADVGFSYITARLDSQPLS
jgi:hypothetical protein